MALLINAVLTTQEGFKTDKSLVFVEFGFGKIRSFAALVFFASKQDFIEGKNDFQQSTVQNFFELDIPKNVFWGNNLMLQIHNYLKTEIEKVTGANTVTIIQDPYS